MKSLKLFLAMIAITAITLNIACKKDDDKPTIVGNWNLTKETYSNCDDPSDNGSEELTCLPDVLCIWIAFDGNGTGKTYFDSAFGKDTTSFTYALNGSSITITEDGDATTGTYSVSGNKLTLSVDDDDCDLTMELTKR